MKLFVGISCKIKVATSLLLKRWSSCLDRQSHCHCSQVWQRQLCDDGKEIWQKVCYMFRVFMCLLIRRCFFIFLFPSSSLWLLELELVSPCKRILVDFIAKPTIWWKAPMKTTTPGTHTEALWSNTWNTVQPSKDLCDECESATLRIYSWLHC